MVPGGELGGAAADWLGARVAGLLEALMGSAPVWLAVGVLLHLLGQVARGQAWHAILHSAWPAAPGLCHRHVTACHVAGAGLTGVLTPRGGDVLRVALVRPRLPEAGLPALAGTLVVEGLFETAVGAMLVAWLAWRGVGALGVEVGDSALAVIAVLAGVTAALALAARRPGVRAALRRAAQSLAILRQPRAYVRHVLPWQALSRLTRFGSVACFLAAFGLPVTAAAVACVVTAHGGGRAVPVPGAAPGAGALLLVAAFPAATGSPADPETLTALALSLSGVLTVVGIALSTLLLVRLAGVHALRRLLRPAPAPTS